jgi:hypothetical protein
VKILVLRVEVVFEGFGGVVPFVVIEVVVEKLVD